MTYKPKRTCRWQVVFLPDGDDPDDQTMEFFELRKTQDADLRIGPVFKMTPSESKELRAALTAFDMGNEGRWYYQLELFERACPPWL